MKQTILLLLLFALSSAVEAREVSVSSTEPVVVSVLDHWESAKHKPPGVSLPAETYRISPTTGNAVCLISVVNKDQPDFAKTEVLKKLLRASSRPYVSSPDELSKIEIKELKISGGVAVYANFIDPDLVDKPVKKGDYKTATPVILSIGTKYLITITVLCDEIDGAHYREAMKMIQSIEIKKKGGSQAYLGQPQDRDCC